MPELRTVPTLPILREDPGATLALGRALTWRTWTDGLAEARTRGLPIVAVAEPEWTNSAQRLALVLGRDERLRTVLAGSVVPVLVDPIDSPAPVDAWHQASIRLTGAIGPPLIVLLTDDGLPFLAYPSMAYEGNERWPSLASVVQSAADTWGTERDAIRAEARALAVPEPGPDPFDAWARCLPLLDRTHGGIDALPRHPLPQLVWLALDQAADETARAWVGTTVDAMLRGGIRDQLDRGFHRCARDGRWVTPHFEKPVPLNAQLAAVFARAAVALDRPEYRTVADELVAFCEAALREGIDAVGSDTAYYTWTSSELLESVPRSQVQPLSLHYAIVPGRRRQALHQAVPRSELGVFTFVTAAEMEATLDQGRAGLLAARRQRPSPALIRLPALAWTAETIRWLFRASAWEVAVPTCVLTDALERLTATSGPAGYAGRVHLADQASILAALLAAHAATGDERWHNRATALGQVLVQAHLADASPPTLGVVDTAIPAPAATLVDGLLRLAGLNNDADLRDRAVRLAARHAPAALAAGPWAAAFATASG
jgi:uncharacterized protein YyaL (SSP411 family)